MIEVRVHPTGDVAFADEPESAVFAARTLMSDARDHGAASSRLRAFFYVGGKLVRGSVRAAELGGVFQ
jgi:hypothetical protein